MDIADSIPENTRKIRVHVASHYAVHRRETRCFDQLCSRCGRSLRVIPEGCVESLQEEDLIETFGIRGGAFVVFDASGWYLKAANTLGWNEEFCS